MSAPKVSAENLAGGVKPYSLTDHIHEREAGHHLSTLLDGEGPVKVAFIPSVAPWFSGIIAVASVPLKGRLTAREVVSLFEEKYAGNKLVRIGKGVPQVRDVQGKHTWSVGGFQVHSEGERVVVVVSFDLEGSVDSQLITFRRVVLITCSRVLRPSACRWVKFALLRFPTLTLLYRT
jgi:N-acetyl-gamma-glutamyl-phosphate reductase/acetylglutamate kinase